jgi:hypothetical protein
MLFGCCARRLAVSRSRLAKLHQQSLHLAAYITSRREGTHHSVSMIMAQWMIAALSGVNFLVFRPVIEGLTSIKASGRTMVYRCSITTDSRPPMRSLRR